MQFFLVITTSSIAPQRRSREPERGHELHIRDADYPRLLALALLAWTANLQHFDGSLSAERALPAPRCGWRLPIFPNAAISSSRLTGTISRGSRYAVGLPHLIQIDLRLLFFP
jgi:hypothetical protein